MADSVFFQWWISKCFQLTMFLLSKFCRMFWHVGRVFHVHEYCICDRNVAFNDWACNYILRILSLAIPSNYYMQCVNNFIKDRHQIFGIVWITFSHCAILFCVFIESITRRGCYNVCSVAGNPLHFSIILILNFIGSVWMGAKMFYFSVNGVLFVT